MAAALSLAFSKKRTARELRRMFAYIFKILIFYFQSHAFRNIFPSPEKCTFQTKRKKHFDAFPHMPSSAFSQMLCKPVSVISNNLDHLRILEESSLPLINTSLATSQVTHSDHGMYSQLLFTSD